MKTAILTDSTCDLPREIKQDLNFLYTIPLNIHFSEEDLTDGKDITSESFFARINQTGEIPSTSQPSAGEFMKTYDHLSAEYDHILSIHLSGELSGTIASAHTAAQQVEGANINIFDSGSASLGLGFLVLFAAKLLKSGSEPQEVLEKLAVAKKRANVYFTVDDLTYLEKGGRIGKAQAFLGSILNFQPLLTLPGEEGEVIPKGKARGKNRFKQKLFDQLQEDLAEDNYAWLGILHGASQENAKELQQDAENLLAEINIEAKIYSNIISPVLGCHTGPTVYGLATLSGEFLDI